jgi:transcriptional antiterminator NusG
MLAHVAVADVQSAKTGRSPQMSGDNRHYAPGDRVRVLDGPFHNHEGVVLQFNPEDRRLKVGVTVAGRKVPIRTEHWQVEKL